MTREQTTTTDTNPANSFLPVFEWPERGEATAWLYATTTNLLDGHYYRIVRYWNGKCQLEAWPDNGSCDPNLTPDEELDIIAVSVSAFDDESAWAFAQEMKALFLRHNYRTMSAVSIIRILE